MQIESTEKVKKIQKIKNKQKVSEQEAIEYIQERFDDVKSSNKINDLVSFQTMNKFMIMAHDQTELKNLGNIVASYKKNSFSKIMKEYEKHLKKSLEKSPTIKSHINVIMHIFGHFSDKFNQSEKEQFFKLLDQFRNEEITIGRILSEINPVIYRFNNMYLASQSYFLLYSDPQPGNLFEMSSHR